MYFRNLTFYRFPASVGLSIREIAARDSRHDAQATPDEYSLQGYLSELAAKPCGSMELSSRGWVSPYGPDHAAMFAQVGNCILLTLGGEDKILPGAAVNAEVQKRVAAIEARDGRKISRRSRNAIRDDLLTELLPRALTKPYRLNGYIDLDRCILVVDTASRRAAEDFVSAIRAMLGTFPALPVNAEVPPRSILTGWIVGDLPESRFDGGGALHLDDSATLQDPTDSGGVVRVSRLELQADEVRNHIDSGRQCTRLGLTLDDRVSFTFDEDLVVRKFKLLDAAIESLESFDSDGLSAEIDARLTLMSGEVGALFDVLAGSMKFSAVEG